MATAFGENDPFVIEQRRAQANLQKAQEMKEFKPAQGPGMVSGIYVRTNPLNHLAQLLRAYQGTQQEKEAQSQLQDIGTRRNQAMADVLRGTQEALTPVPEQRVATQADYFDEADRASLGDSANMTAVTPERKANPMRANEILMNSPFPQFQQRGYDNMMAMQQKQAEQAQAQAERQRMTDLWKQSGGDANKFAELTGDPDAAMKFAELSKIGQPSVVRTVDTVDSRGRPVTQGYDANNNPVGPAIPKYVPPKAPAAPRAPNVIANGTMILGPDGVARPIVGVDGKPIASSAAPKPLNEGQSNATTYGLRMQEADKILKDLEAKGNFDTGRIRAGVSGTLGALPLVGDSLRGGSDNIFNWLPSAMGGLNPEEQQTMNARVNFITAVLRKESGAAIGQNEFDTAEKLYFPQPGDSPAVVQQKQSARQQAIKGMKISAGPGAADIEAGMGGGGAAAPTSSGW